MYLFYRSKSCFGKLLGPLGGPLGTPGPWGPWALGTPRPWGPLGLGDPWALGTSGPWGPLGLGDPGPWGPLGPWGRSPWGAGSQQIKETSQTTKRLASFFTGQNNRRNVSL